MEDTIRRPGQARYGQRVRRTKSRNKNRDRMPVIRNVVIAVMILAILWGVKSLDIPIAKNFVNYVKRLLSVDITMNDIYLTIDNIINKLRDGKTQGLENSRSKLPLQEKSPADNGNKNGGNDTYTLSATTGDGKLLLPLNGNIVSGYGERIDPTSGTGEFHSGVDIQPIDDTDVMAIMDGEVVDIGNSKNYGKYVSIKNNDGCIIIYAHCSSIYVFKGASIKQGDVIADIKASVPGIGTHLHLEVWKDGNHIDPEKFVVF